MQLSPPSRALRVVPWLLAAAALASCSSDPWNDPALGEPFVPAVKTQRRAGRLFEDANPSISTGAGGASVTMVDRSLWLMGDLSRGLRRNRRIVGPALVSTARVDWPASDNADVIPADVPLPVGAYVRWTAGISAGADAAVLHYIAVRPGAAGEPGLDYLGAGVATLAGDTVSAATDDADWRFFGRGDPAFGLAVVQADHGVTTGMDYIFGVRGDAGTDRVYLARVPHGRGAERAEYRFLADDGEWSESVKDAAPLFRAGPGGMSVSWNDYLGAFLAVYAWVVPGDGKLRPPRLRVMARTARHPSGPWGAETALFEARGVHAGGRVRFGHGAREHRQLARYSGRIIFVSVDGGPEAGAQQPAPPRMWRVEFPEIR